jgi:hypothetical protein
MPTVNRTLPVCSSSPLVPSLLHPLLHPSKRPSSRDIVQPALATDVSIFCLRFVSTPTLALATTHTISPAPALHGNIDFAEALDSARIIPAQVAERQRARTEQNALEKWDLFSLPSSSSASSASFVYGDVAGNSNKGKAKPLSINNPLHGPVVGVVLAWLCRSRVIVVEE